MEALNIDRSALIRIRTQTGCAQVTHAHAVEGVAPVQRLLVARDANPWALSMAIANRLVAFSRLDDLPPEASVDKASWRRVGLKSHVMVPIMVAGHLHGTLNFGSIRVEREWTDELLGRMRLLAEIFGSALARQRAEEEVERAIGFERLASSILASLVLTRPDEQGQVICHALRTIGEFVGADQVALWRDTSRDGRYEPIQRWSAEGLSVQPDPPAYNLPWLARRMADRDVVRLSTLDELLSAAHVDVNTLRALGIRSLFMVPVEGEQASALLMTTVARHHTWADALLPGVRLLADVLGSLHARESAERRRLAAEVEASHWRERLAHLVRVHTAGEMSVALAHEITQPLGAIENYAIAARRRASEASPDMPKVAELLDKVIGQSTRAGDVVTRMRSMAKRHELDPKPIRIERAVRECVGMVKMDCDLRDIRIELPPASPGPTVVVDEIHVQQVLLNLMRNAMEAIELAPLGGAREIAVAVAIRAGERDEVRVDVADRGVGITEGDLERIFESFYSTKSSGLGVGLAICRKLIEAHGGKLWASHNPGGGAIFSFTLPQLP
ncbi:ATP-binding protein [Variovorax ginsengisoli]|uniref:histidine kinase n=1 Tax=Variovorax ginsengisoli TaxID=363844 RepID=A0ABT8SFQ8_9BURK|nr:ATP-binding protein [Variovorax ginsengisoli]MDN8618581.1 ATP-binding protein [Variovorax ginsengisoli]MDO1537751.1 ATP-binding protein [Variovorax ginsengisoli]